MIRRPPRSTLSSSSAASDVYKRQVSTQSTGIIRQHIMVFTAPTEQLVAFPGGTVHRTRGNQCIEAAASKKFHGFRHQGECSNRYKYYRTDSRGKVYYIFDSSGRTYA
eukprot:TRINITY_DN8882_c0_g1_i6.p2 TRINITY_DN8882_c0_g1~~TRINITY_DN8882_c0_g1_i6.p2  ORF type:complete len:108 (+),score=11.31 TRINITY_DN8882_c0_g1_i6:92-415(+)